VVEKNWKPPHNISIEALMGKLRGEYSEPVLIELYVGADDKNSSINILQVNPRPSSLSLFRIELAGFRKKHRAEIYGAFLYISFYSWIS
jgi:hypothetical protein